MAFVWLLHKNLKLLIRTILDCVACINVRMHIHGVPVKTHKVWHMISFEPFAVKSSFLHQNVRQILLFTNQRKICVNGLHIFFAKYPELFTRLQWSRVHVNIAHGGLPVDKIMLPNFIPSNWPPNSHDLNPVDYSIWDALQQLVYRQKIKDIDHLKQVLNSCWDTDQPRTNQWCYWPAV